MKHKSKKVKRRQTERERERGSESKSSKEGRNRACRGRGTKEVGRILMPIQGKFDSFCFGLALFVLGHHFCYRCGIVAPFFILSHLAAALRSPLGVRWLVNPWFLASRCHISSEPRAVPTLLTRGGGGCGGCHSVIFCAPARMEMPCPFSHFACLKC